MAEHHTYFVGENKVWVHNMCPKTVEKHLRNFRMSLPLDPTTKKPKPANGRRLLAAFSALENDKNNPISTRKNDDVDNRSFGHVAYAMSKWALRYWVFDCQKDFLANASSYSTETQRLTHMLNKADSDNLGLKALRAVVKLSGDTYGKGQGGWEVHHIPETWLWGEIQRLGGHALPWPGGDQKANHDRAPCIPLPGMLYLKSAAGLPKLDRSWLN